MDWLKGLHAAIDYLEENLDGKISYAKAAQAALCSEYHFSRMFSYLTGVSVSEYVRRRRLTMAAFRLQSGDEKIIDLALMYGYDSPDAFSRAFKKQHGISPAAARELGAALRSFPRLSFQITCKGELPMDFRMEERPAFQMFGKSGKIDNRSLEAAFREVPAFCRSLDEDGTVDRMNAFLGRFHDSYLHAALYGHTEEHFRYMVCYFAPVGLTLPEEFERLEVPACTWAIFTAKGCAVQDIWSRVYREWFPESGYEQVAGPQFEMYYGIAGHTAVGEVWIPVKKV